MCTHVHISVIKWCNGGYGTGALWVSEIGLLLSAQVQVPVKMFQITPKQNKTNVEGVHDSWDILCDDIYML